TARKWATATSAPTSASAWSFAKPPPLHRGQRD
ncbi:uncharacterized protein METZ01_LOCUS485441, partial [marine metagenome]